MKAFLVHCALFLAIFALLFLAASGGDRLLRRDPRTERQRAFVETQSGKTIAILGDSHAALGIDAQELPKEWISFAYPADNLSDMFAKLLYLEKRHPLRTILLPIDYHIITQFREEHRNICASLPLLTDKEALLVWDMPRVSLLFTRARCTLPLLEKAEREKAMTALTEKLLSLLGRPPQQANFDFSPAGGWVTTDAGLRLTLAPEHYRTDAADVVRRQLVDAPIVPSLLSTYGNIIRYAHDHNLRVVGIRYPLDPAYLADLPEKRSREIEEALQTLPFDARFDWSALLKNSPSAFYNSDHVNATGANLLTRALVKAMAP